MNEVVLPPAPNWYNDSVLICTPDNNVVYASRRDIVILKPAPLTEAAEVNIIHNAHLDRVLSVSANFVTWGNPHKQIVSVGDDKAVQLWDFEKLSSIMQHKGHDSNNSPIVTASFAGERIISVAENGQVIVWRTSTNTTQTLSNIFGMRVKVMCMATCPHASYITAFGLNTGLVVVADLRRTGKVLYRMREHDHDITGLAWCPVPYNIYKTVSGIQLMNSLKKKISRPLNKYKEIQEDKNNISSSASSETSLEVSEINSNLNTSNKDSSTEENKSGDFQSMFAQKCAELQIGLTQKEDLKSEESKENEEESTNLSLSLEESSKKESPETPKKKIDDTPKKGFEDDNELPEIKYPIRERPVVDKNNPWGNVVFNDSDEEIEEAEETEPKKQSTADFLAECLKLRNKIINYSNETDEEETNKQNDSIEPEQDDITEELFDKTDNEIVVRDEKLETEKDISKEKLPDKNEVEIQTNNEIILIEDNEIIENIPLKDETTLTDSMKNLSVCVSESVEEKTEKVIDVLNLNATKSSLNLQININNSNIIEKDEHMDYEAANINDIEQNKDIPPKNLLEYVQDLSLLDPESSKDFLLASACRGGAICIWRAFSDGRLEIQLPRHLKSTFSNKKKDNRQNWLSLCWAQPTLLLSSSIWHELLAWDLMPKPNKNMKYIIKSSLIHADHKKHVFSIAVPFKIYLTPEEDNWHSNKEICVWTTSQDRWLLRTNLSTRCNVACYSTFGGLVTCLTVSQLDPNRIALAVGDGTIRVWDLSRPHVQHIIMTTFFDKVHTKASSIDWHPTKENCLAFSTCEGRIGEYDLTNRAKAATIYSNYHRSAVYKIQWGPLPNNEPGKYGLYSCSLGELVVHDGSRPHKEPYQVSIFEDENVTTFAWKADYSVLAVGSKSGSVRVVTKEFKVIQTLYVQKKSIRSLEWHPLATAFDSGISEFANYLAVATMENNIYVYDCSNHDDDGAQGDHGDVKTTLNQKVIVLKGHENGVRYISWCPHIGGRMVSSCEDGIAIVWDVKTQTILSTFNSSPDCGPSIVWSPLDADLIILGGKLLRIWRITKNPPVLPIIPRKLENKHKKLTQMALNESENDTSVSKKDNKARKDEKEKRKVILNTVSKLQFDNEHALKTCKKLLEKFNASTNLNESIKHIDGSSDSENEHFEDAKEHYETEPEFAADPVKLFGNRKDVLTLLDYEQSIHLERKKIQNHGHIGLWKGSLVDTIKYALELNIINPWIISMAPMVSHKLWLELSEKYAHILSENSDYLEASTYYLACHKVDDAIEALCKGTYFKEALALAQVRLPEGNNTIPTIYDGWLKHSIMHGNFELAAQCYIKMGKFSEAGEILNKRSDLETLQFAAELAEKSKNKDLLTSINLKLDDLKKEEKVTEPKLDGINICESRLAAIMIKNTNDTTEVINDNKEELIKEIEN